MHVSGDEQFRSIILMLKLFEAATKDDLAATRALLAKHEEKLHAMHSSTELKLAAMHADIQSLLQRQGGVTEVAPQAPARGAQSFLRSSSGTGSFLPDFQTLLQHNERNIVKERATDVSWLAGGGAESGMNPAGAVGVTPTASVFKHGSGEASGYGSAPVLASREALPPAVFASLSVSGDSEASRPVKVSQETKPLTPRNQKEQQSSGRIPSPSMMPQNDIVLTQKMNVRLAVELSACAIYSDCAALSDRAEVQSGFRKMCADTRDVPTHECYMRCAD